MMLIGIFGYPLVGAGDEGEGNEAKALAETAETKQTANAIILVTLEKHGNLFFIDTHFNSGSLFRQAGIEPYSGARRRRQTFCKPSTTRAMLS